MKKHVLFSLLLTLALTLWLAGPAGAQFFGVGGRPPGTYGGFYGGGYMNPGYGGYYGGLANPGYGGYMPGYGGYGQNYPLGAYNGYYGLNQPYGSNLYGSGGYPYGAVGAYGVGGYPYGAGINNYYGGYPGMGINESYYGGFGGYPAVGAGVLGSNSYSSLYPPSGGIALSSKMDKGSGGVTTSVSVKVPAADAQVWFGGVKTKQSGVTRDFVTPALPAGKKFKYEVRAVWKEQGVDVEHNQTVTFLPGENVVIDFTKPGATEKKPAKGSDKDSSK